MSPTAISAVFAVLWAGSLAGQTQNVQVQANCLLPFSFTDAAVKQLPDNTGPQCRNWTVGYSSYGFTGLTLSVQVAPDAGNTPGTWVDWPGTVVSGSQPNASVTQASTQLLGYYRWVRVSLSGLTGSGGVSGVLYGTSDAGPEGPQGPTGPQGPPGGGFLAYYLTPTASATVPADLQMTALPYTPKTTLSFAALPTGTDQLQNWVTNLGVPNLTFLPAGEYLLHVHASRSGGGTVTLFAQIWEVSSTGVDIAMIGQTVVTNALTGSEVELEATFLNPNVYTFATPASRLVTRLFATVSGSAPTVSVYVGGTADSHLSLPTSATAISASNIGGALSCVSAGGSGTAYTCAMSPPVSTCTADALLVNWVPDVTNGASPTLNPGCGAKAILTNSGAVPAVGAIAAGGQQYLLWYDGTHFRLPPAGPGYLATSTTSVTVGTGSQTFTTQAGLAYSTGARARATSTGTGAYVEGLVTSYSGTTLVINADATSGSGAHTDWDINVAGNVGATGAAGAAGPGYLATSTTSVTVGTGSQTFTTQAGLAYSTGARARATSTGTGAYVEGLVTSYSGTTLVINADATSGSGAHTDWDINVAGNVGSHGARWCGRAWLSGDLHDAR